MVKGIPWIVAVDELAGSTHQLYVGMADPAYLIADERRVSYDPHQANAQTLHEAIEALPGQGGRGVVLRRRNRFPHVGAAVIDGWMGLRSGWSTNTFDTETALLRSASGALLGHQFRPLLVSLTLRAEPLSKPVRFGLLAGVEPAGIALFTRSR